jgi:hypothetical protein
VNVARVFCTDKTVRVKNVVPSGINFSSSGKFETRICLSSSAPGQQVFPTFGRMGLPIRLGDGVSN